MEYYNRSAFALVEFLLVVAIVAILAGIVILVVNPAKQLADARNAQRWSDVSFILDGVYQYTIDHDGKLPASLVRAGACSADVADAEICRMSGDLCGSLTNLSILTEEQSYFLDIPSDPLLKGGVVGTGYYIVLQEGNSQSISVCAPHAEGGMIIAVSR